MHVQATQEIQLELKDVWEAVERLSPVLRPAFDLVVINGKAYKDAAVILDLPVGTVKSRVGRAHIDIRETMELKDANRPPRKKRKSCSHSKGLQQL